MKPCPAVTTKLPFALARGPDGLLTLIYAGPKGGRFTTLDGERILWGDVMVAHLRGWSS